MKYTEAYWAEKTWREKSGSKPSLSVYIANSEMLAGCVEPTESYTAYAHPFIYDTLLTREEARAIRGIHGREEAWTAIEEKTGLLLTTERQRAIKDEETRVWKEGALSEKAKERDEMKDYDKAAGLDASKVSTIVHLPIVLIAIAIGVLVLWLGRVK